MVMSRVGPDVRKRRRSSCMIYHNVDQPPSGRRGKLSIPVVFRHRLRLKGQRGSGPVQIRRGDVGCILGTTRDVTMKCARATARASARQFQFHKRDIPEDKLHSDQYGRRKGWPGRLIGRTNGFEGKRNCPMDRLARERNTRLHVICDSQGSPLNLLIIAGQVSRS